MMKATKIALLALGVVLALASYAGAAPVRLAEGEAQEWIRHTIPLPKRIDIPARVVLSRAVVVIVADGERDQRIAHAVRELRQAAGVGEEQPPPAQAALRILLQLGGRDAERLRELPNSDQAYRIMADEAGRELRLIALEPAGLLYAGRTLAQLIAARAGDGTITIPLADVTDWPDMSVRGVWGSDSAEHMRWLGAIKLNHQEQISAIGVGADGRGWGRLKSGREPMVDLGPQLNVHPVPVVLHLEQVGGKGVFDAYPKLGAIGGGEGAICYSQPAIVDVLADWIAALGKLRGVSAVDVWMSENLHGKGGCRCQQCSPHDRSVLEAQAIVAGWRRAQERIGPIGLYLLTSEETEPSNPKVLARLPNDLRVWYYHSLLTYTAHRAPMIRGYLVEAARRGRWIGVCPSLVSMVGFDQPFTGAAFVHARMNEFVNKGMSGLLAYITPRLHYHAFNLEAAAEWSWHAGGRSPREFAASFATRHGIGEAELFTEWSETIGAVAWELHGSHFPGGDQRGTPGAVAQLLRRGKLPELGSVLWGVYPAPWGQIRSPQQFGRNVEQARRAIALARRLGDAAAIAESEMIQGYAGAQQALWELKQLVRAAGIAPADRDAARRWFAVYADGLEQAASALPRWEASVARAGDGAFTKRTAAFLRRMIEQMQAVAAELSEQE